MLDTYNVNVMYIGMVLHKDCTVDPLYSGPQVDGEVAALERCLMCRVCHLELELSGCNKEVASLHSDHYTLFSCTEELCVCIMNP
jgi:hypothetical protein